MTADLLVSLGTTLLLISAFLLIGRLIIAYLDNIDRGGF